MITYKDQTWCTKDSCVNEAECSRFYSDEEKKKARDWWGSPFVPIALSDFPECPYWEGDFE